MDLIDNYMFIQRVDNSLLVPPSESGMPLNTIGFASPLTDLGEGNALAEGMPVMMFPQMEYSISLSRCPCGKGQTIQARLTNNLSRTTRFFIGKIGLDYKPSQERFFPFNNSLLVDLTLHMSPSNGNRYEWSFNEIPKDELVVKADSHMGVEILHFGRAGNSINLYVHEKEPCLGKVPITEMLRIKSRGLRYPVRGFEEMIDRVERLVS